MKESKLEALLKKFHKGGNKIIIFCLYKLVWRCLIHNPPPNPLCKCFGSNIIVLTLLHYQEAARVEATLQRKGFNAVAIHGDKSQVNLLEYIVSVLMWVDVWVVYLWDIVDDLNYI